MKPTSWKQDYLDRTETEVPEEAILILASHEAAVSPERFKEELEEEPDPDLDEEYGLGILGRRQTRFHGACCVLERCLPSIHSQERQRIQEARRETDGVPFLDAARALCPDEAHWEDGGWERYEADASACLDAFFAALDTLDPSGEGIEIEDRELEPWEQDEARGIVERLIEGLRQAAGPRSREPLNVLVAAENLHLAADLLAAQLRQSDPSGEQGEARTNGTPDSRRLEAIATVLDEGGEVLQSTPLFLRRIALELATDPSKEER